MSESDLPSSNTTDNKPPKKLSNPLYGLKLDTLLTEISDCYGWLNLSEVLNIERLQFHTGLKSTMKFLRNHEWAKEKVENFYLYCYKNYPWPDDKQLAIAPRNRSNFTKPESDTPAPLTAELNRLIEHASDIRNANNKILRDKTDNKAVNDEPPYDPSNPWNK